MKNLLTKIKEVVLDIHGAFMAVAFIEVKGSEEGLITEAFAEGKFKQLGRYFKKLGFVKTYLWILVTLTPIVVLMLVLSVVSVPFLRLLGYIVQFFYNL